MSCTRPGLSKALLFVVMSGVAVFGQGATKTWSGLPESKFWSNGDNWNGGFAPFRETIWSFRSRISGR